MKPWMAFRMLLPVVLLILSGIFVHPAIAFAYTVPLIAFIGYFAWIW